MIRIVLVEDLDLIREGIRVLVSQIDDFEIVAEYSNGKELVDNIKHLQVDIIVTDIDMPVMDGITATRKVLAMRSDLKVIALSLYNESQYYHDLVAAGAKGFILKQASIQELEEGIREVYKGGSYFSQELLQNVIKNMKYQDSALKSTDDSENITEKEAEMLKYICEGLTNQELADKLFVSVKTIESNKARLMRKTNSRNNAALILWAIKNKIVKL
nr:response regulator transcription factor [uncultured Carboxylicivirga sp.]